MIKSGDSLEAVVDNLIIGKKIPNQHVDDYEDEKDHVSGWGITTQ